MSAAPFDASAKTALKQYCADCHMAGADEGGFAIQADRIDWSNPETLHDWEQIHEMVSRGIMPPPDSQQPSTAERQSILKFVDAQLIQHTPIGGTMLRRLNRREYEKTIQRLFGIKTYNVPHGFPPDNTAGGFDTQASALVLAGSHLEALSEAATGVADQLFPPPPRSIEPQTFLVPADEMVISYSSACLVDGAMRLASSGDNVVRHATWPTKFEAPASGIYRLKVTATAIQPPETQPILTIATMRAADRGELRVVQQFEVANEKPQTRQFSVSLNRGDTVVLRYLNGPFDYENDMSYKTFLTKLFTDDPTLAAAWAQVGEPPRGGSGWERVKEAMQTAELEVSKFVDDEEAIAELVETLTRNKVASGETLVYKFFEAGPAIAISSMELFGPVKSIRDREQILSDQLRQDFVGAEFAPDDTKSLRKLLDKFLTDAFRRPAFDHEIRQYLDLVNHVRAESGSLDQGLHLAIRTALLSPAFLYRGFGQGELSSDELATRLSYFLTAAPPTKQLKKAVQSGKLQESAVLRREAQRMMGRSFCDEFSTQWLGTDEVDRLMPDMRLTTRFSPRHRSTVRKEVGETFHYILSENLPVTDFIDPDYVFTDYEVGRDIYDLPQFKTTRKNRPSKARRNKMVKATVPRGGRHGGLLCMPAVMMSTANGVDTQPVLRGVWALENIFGSPPPPPPDAVPALTPDTSAATTVRERLAAHMSDASCAQCHREIDPIGFALESFDPIGRWRDHYPQYVEKDGKTIAKNGNAVQSDGVLPDGTPINDVRDLKRWLAEHPTVFASCLSVKLLTYATGRQLNYRERSLVGDIVQKEQSEHALRFQDLLLALIDSPIFRTK
ncbi:DUF1588 domain-containing protein [Stieleria marina]|uniref:DUF1588 domain-containing protein n=1 Tax=Stieleria marina TaxID=1930275 RepID=UPI003AF35429